MYRSLDEEIRLALKSTNWSTLAAASDRDEAHDGEEVAGEESCSGLTSSNTSS